MKNYLFVILILLLLACQTKPVGDKNETLTNLFDSIDKFSASVEDSLGKGYHPHGKWMSNSQESQMMRADSLKKYLVALESISDASLSVQEKIIKAVMRINLQDQIDFVTYKMILIPFNAEGGFYNQFSYVLPSLPFNSAKDYYDYLACQALSRIAKPPVKPEPGAGLQGTPRSDHQGYFRSQPPIHRWWIWRGHPKAASRRGP